MPAPESAIATPADQDWWQQLNDPAIDTLVDAALADSPYVAQAIARVEEARALADVTAAQRIPSMALSASSTRACCSDFAGSTTSASLSERSSIGLGFSWEIDLFGRVRNSIEARTLRIEARDSAAMASRVALTAQVGDAFMARRHVATQALALLGGCRRTFDGPRAFRCRGRPAERETPHPP